ncbi:MAG: hypothetical protein JWP89_6016 [Schlesneria sp.]|nr:hypothetical protein [Schlesneria sp.]
MFNSPLFVVVDRWQDILRNFCRASAGRVRLDGESFVISISGVPPSDTTFVWAGHSISNRLRFHNQLYPKEMGRRCLGLAYVRFGRNCQSMTGFCGGVRFPDRDFVHRLTHFHRLALRLSEYCGIASVVMPNRSATVDFASARDFAVSFCQYFASAVRDLAESLVLDVMHRIHRSTSSPRSKQRTSETETTGHTDRPPQRGRRCGRLLRSTENGRLLCLVMPYPM